MTTRTGKIARPPHDIREQLNRRLRDGETRRCIKKSRPQTGHEPATNNRELIDMTTQRKIPLLHDLFTGIREDGEYTVNNPGSPICRGLPGGVTLLIEY